MRINAIGAIMLAALAAIFVFAPDLAFAQGATPGGGGQGNIFGTLQSKSSSTFANVRIVMFIIGGFGFIGIAAMAFFGRFDWKWGFSLVGGLMILAAAGGLIYYATHTEAGGLGNAAGGIESLRNSDTLN